MNARLKSLMFALAMGLGLQGCGDASARMAALQNGIPMVTVIHEPSGKETVLTGSIQPRMDFSSTFAGRSPEGMACDGAFNSRGVGTVTCANGLVMAIAIPKDKYGTLDNSYVQTVDGIGTAVGWGSAANADVLRGMM